VSSLIQRGPGPTNEEVHEIAARLSQAMAGPPVPWPPLPRRVRLRLWLTGCINTAAYRLVCSGHDGAAILLWRACGMWS
jgi:hypothetical protein